MFRVRFFEVFSNPFLEVGSGVWPWVSHRRPDSVQLSKSNTKRHVLNIMLGDNVILGNRKRRELQELKQCLTGETPSFLVSVRKSFRMRERLRERDHSSLAIQGPSKLLRFGEDDIKIERSEESLQVSILLQIRILMANVLSLHFVSDLDKEIRTVAFVVMSGDEVVETDESEGEVLRLVVLQTG